MNDIVTDLSSEFKVDASQLHQNIRENQEKFNLAFSSQLSQAAEQCGVVGSTTGGDVPLVPDQNTTISVTIDGEEVKQPSSNGKEEVKESGKEECSKEECTKEECSECTETCSNSEECCSN